MERPYRENSGRYRTHDKLLFAAILEGPDCLIGVVASLIDDSAALGNNEAV